MITMEDIEKRLSAVEDDTKEILTLLKSNADFNQKGLVETVQDNKDRISLLEVHRKMEQAKNGTIAAVVSAIFVVVGFMIQAWINKKI